uniref:Uncharacterized protein n=1 Tax=Tanacetum cinerariifolium TaxID=118510 RepID=A0A6L2JZ55_TANCI|nr:hypothetical protein [Tanacetum cinerariifolium]
MGNNRRDHVVYNLVQGDGELRHMRHEKGVLGGVAAFSVVYDSVQWMDKNGSSDLVLFQNALAEFETMDKKTTKSNPPTPEKPPMTLISSFSTIAESTDDHEICDGYLIEKATTTTS